MLALRTACTACTLHALRPKNWSACTFLAFLSYTRDTSLQMDFDQFSNFQYVALLHSCMLSRWDAMHRTPTITLQVACIRFSAFAARSIGSLILLKQVLYVGVFQTEVTYVPCRCCSKGTWRCLDVDQKKFQSTMRQLTGDIDTGRKGDIVISVLLRISNVLISFDISYNI